MRKSSGISLQHKMTSILGISFYIYQTVFVVLSIACGSCAQIRYPASNISLADQIYDFSSQHRCRLLAHESIILKNGDHYLLILEGGFGKFKLQLDNQDVEVQDLNGYTVAFDLSESFVTPELEPVWQIKKNATGPRPPITNFFGLFSDREQNSIYIQGGHFYNVAGWNSSYFVPKESIPPWELWRLDIRTKEWANITVEVQNHELANRTFGGAAESVSALNKSYYIGGIIDETTGSATPMDTYQPTSQMLVYDHSAGRLDRVEYYAPPATEGYWHGNLIHIPVGPQKGFLLSLMSQKQTLGRQYADPEAERSVLGKPVSFESVQIYDLEAEQWYEQETLWFKSDDPVPRTRFCAALFHDEIDSTWDLWIHGGQKLGNQEEGVSDIYVLSMPSFTWTKLTTTLADQNFIKSHTCHAVGGQLLLVGGYPPGAMVAANASCDPEIVKVLQITEDGPVWTPKFSTNTTYRAPITVREMANGRRSPIDGWASPNMENVFDPPSPPTTPPRPDTGRKIGSIVGGVIGGLIFLTIIGLVVIYVRRRRRRRIRVQSPIEEVSQHMLYTTDNTPELENTRQGMKRHVLVQQVDLENRRDGRRMPLPERGEEHDHSREGIEISGPVQQLETGSPQNEETQSTAPAEVDMIVRLPSAAAEPLPPVKDFTTDRQPGHPPSQTGPSQ